MSVSGEAGAVGREFLPQEDTVEYCLYSLEEHESQQLATLAAQCSQHAQHITRKHIWHYDSFSLEVCAGKRGSQPACLCGSTCFRENVEDEWLIVYILFSISRLCTQLVISVRDNDGQLLLVEAAHKLPPWLEPETAANRVFIHKGRLHIIPKPRSPAEVTSLPVSSPTIQEAVRIVLDEAIPTVASEPIQQCIRERLKPFSEDLGSELHFAHCYVPLPVAHVMSHDPQLVSAAVHALCDRDPIDMKACQRMAHFSPCNHSSIVAGVMFTKCLYAQVLHQRFSAPRNSGFSMPPAGNQRHTACELGMKLTCGLEILVSRVKHRESKTSCSTSECLEGDMRWQKFIKSLESKGYFQDEIEGSRLYQQLLSSAKEHFISHLQNETEEPLLSPLALSGRKALHILQNMSLSEEELVRRSDHLKPPDDDSWLQISPEELDVMIKRAAGYLPPSSGAPSGHPKVQQGLGAEAAASEEEGSARGGGEDLDLQSMVYGMKSFVEKVSSHKGAEFPWTGKDSSEVTFDPDSVLDMMKVMLNTVSPDEEERRTADSMDDVDLLSDGDFSGAEDEDDLSVSDESSIEEEDVSGAGKEERMEEIMEAMDREISSTEVGKSFEKLKIVEDPEEDHTKVGGAIQPVDVDFNLVKNLLESYTSQEGGAGPASNILQSLGIHIPEQDSCDLAR